MEAGCSRSSGLISIGPRRGRGSHCKETHQQEKVRASLQSVTGWLRMERRRPLSWIRGKLSQKLLGYWNYYGVIGNSRELQRCWRAVKKLCWRWLNRRSQRRSYRTQGFEMMWEAWGLPKPRIVEMPYRPAAA